jgi:nucleotide-binding universal stress UspA family protein
MSNVTASTAQPFVLIVALDLTDTASGGYALDQATRIAGRVPGSQLHVLHVSTEDVKSETLGLLRHYVSAKATALGGPMQQTVAVHVRSGDPAHEIVQLATDLSADLVIVGTHKMPHLKNLFVGSTAERVMQSASCPVVVAGPRPKPEPPHVIVIEPACPVCVQTRFQTGGRSWWCERHSEHHAVLTHHHIYSYESGLPFEDHDYEVAASGTD